MILVLLSNIAWRFGFYLKIRRRRTQVREKERERKKERKRATVAIKRHTKKRTRQEDDTESKMIVCLMMIWYDARNDLKLQIRVNWILEKKNAYIYANIYRRKKNIIKRRKKSRVDVWRCFLYFFVLFCFICWVKAALVVSFWFCLQVSLFACVSNLSRNK